MIETRVLVIDDEPQIHRFLRPALEGAGYVVDRAETAAEGLRLVASRSPALVLLDLGLPDMDGQTVLQTLRATSAVPVVVLSARDRDEEKVRALDNGADDYVEKPFSVAELLARVRAALRHARPANGRASEYFAAGPLAIDMARRVVSVAGEPVQLSPLEYALLTLLARDAGRVLTHGQLLTGIWGPAHRDDVQYLRVYVGHLRQKLGAAAVLLTTEPGSATGCSSRVDRQPAPSASLA